MAEKESTFKVDKSLVDVSSIVMRDVLGVKSGESMLIATNPDENPLEISKSLFNAATKYDVEPTMIIQKKRASDGKTDKRVLAAISTIPDIYISVSALSLGQDTGFNVLGQRYEAPYKFEELERSKVFEIARNKGRGFWSPHITKDIWLRAVPVDYKEMRILGEKVAERLTDAEEIHVTTDKGTDVTFSFKGMICEPSTGPYFNK
jgi:leucyl aminopeptidase (aminopeptidase T)